MNPLRLLKDFFRRQLDARGYQIYHRPYLPKGADVFLSLHAHWRDWQPEVIFDVGANVGQTVARLRPLFPRAQIHAFEPVPATCEQLHAAIADDSRCHAHCLALAEAAGEAIIHVHASSDQSSLNPALRDSTSVGSHDQRVTLDTAAAFCMRQGIARIGLLKIDVAGYELPVLRGAAPLLTAGAIDFVVAEAGLGLISARFTSLNDLSAYLQPHGFHLVGVYEQYGWRFTQTAEFCNALFAHERHLTRGVGE